MKKIVLFSIAISATGAAFAQNGNVGIGTTTPNADAKLDITATNKGLLLPRIALTGTASAAPLSAHVAGMTVYNTKDTLDVTKGTYFNNGTKWVRVADAGSTPWNDFVTGQPATNSIQNIQRNGNVFIGNKSNNLSAPNLPNWDSVIKYSPLSVNSDSSAAFSFINNASKYRFSGIGSFTRLNPFDTGKVEDGYINFMKQPVKGDSLRRYGYIQFGEYFRGLVLQADNGNVSSNLAAGNLSSYNILLNYLGGRVGVGLRYPTRNLSVANEMAIVGDGSFAYVSGVSNYGVQFAGSVSKGDISAFLQKESTTGIVDTSLLTYTDSNTVLSRFSGYDYRSARIAGRQGGAAMDIINAGSITASSKPSKITFSTTGINDTTMRERMVIDPSGKVGIGVKNPYSKLQVRMQVTPGLNDDDIVFEKYTGGSTFNAWSALNPNYALRAYRNKDVR